MKPTNGTSMQNPQTERTDTNETHQQKNILKPTNGTNMHTCTSTCDIFCSHLPKDMKIGYEWLIKCVHNKAVFLIFLRIRK